MQDLSTITSIISGEEAQRDDQTLPDRKDQRKFPRRVADPLPHEIGKPNIAEFAGVDDHSHLECIDSESWSDIIKGSDGDNAYALELGVLIVSIIDRLKHVEERLDEYERGRVRPH